MRDDWSCDPPSTRGKSYSFLAAPRTFIANSPTCSAISAHARTCHAHAIHKTLLAMNHQKPISRRWRFCDATSQAANSVTAMAGHWIASSIAPLTSSSVVGLLERGDFELAHLQQRLHDAFRLRVRLAEPVDHFLRHHLPREPVLVLEPAADVRLGIAAGGELAPVVVQLLLVVDVDLQRHRFVELEERAAVERGEGLS